MTVLIYTYNFNRRGDVTKFQAGKKLASCISNNFFFQLTNF